MALTDYTATTWKDDEAGGTDITAARLNNIEQGITKLYGNLPNYQVSAIDATKSTEGAAIRKPCILHVYKDGQATAGNLEGIWLANGDGTLTPLIDKASTSTLTYDAKTGEYSNVGAWWDAHRDGRVYGVKFPKYTYSHDYAGAKTRDNTGLRCGASTDSTAGEDDYQRLNAFRVIERHHRRRRQPTHHRHRRRRPIQTRRQQRRRLRHDMRRILSHRRNRRAP